MTIDDVIKSFNYSLNRLRGNKNNNTFMTYETYTRVLHDDMREFTVNIYLIDKTDGSKQLIYKNVHTTKWELDDISIVFEKQYINVLSDLIILFKMFGTDMANGTYKSQLENINIFT